MKGAHEFTPLGGLNSDDSLELIPAEDYTKAFDCEIGFTNDGMKGTIRSMRGDKVVTQNLVPGTYTTLGSTQDNDNNKLIQFLFEENGEHTIQYIDSNDVAEIIVRGIVVGLNKNRINTANVIDGILTWTQEGQPPKAFIIDKAIRFRISQGTDPEGYSTITADTLLAGAIPPNFRPQARYLTLPDVKSNFVADQTYQFSYFFIYDDNSRSTPSPISRLLYPITQYDVTGKLFQTDNLRNAIEVSFKTGTHNVEKVVILFREGNIGAWQIFRTVVKKDEGLLNNTIAFTNFVGLEAGELYSATFRNFDYLPITADFQEYLNTNQIVYGKYTAGHDKVKPIVELVHEKVNPAITSSVALDFYNTISSEDRGNSYVYFDEPPLAGETVVITLKPDLFFINPNQPAITFDNPTYSFQWTPDVIPLVITYEVTEQDVANGLHFFMNQLFTIAQSQVDVYNETYIDELSFALLDTELDPDPTIDFLGTSYLGDILTGDAIGIKFFGLLTELQLATRETGTDRFVFFESKIVNSATPKITKSFKSGSYVHFCLNYHDKFNRDNAGITNRDEGISGFRVYVPSVTEQPAANALDIYANIINSKIYHKPPLFATHYQWAIAPSVNIQSFGYFMVETYDGAFDAPNSLASIGLNPYGLDPLSNNAGNTINHLVTKGDIIRKYSNNSDPAYPFDQEYVEYEVYSVDGNTVVYKTYPTFDIAVESIIEIYTPRLTSDEGEFYQEFGQEYAIIDANTEARRHAGGVTDQSADLVTPAETVIDNGDVFVRQRDYPLSGPGILPYIEDNRFSDWFTLPDSDKGRVVIYDPNAKQEEFVARFLHGGFYVADTIINDLWSISAFNTESVGVNFGAITGLVMKGYTLQVYQMQKVNSVYIGRIMATNADGETNQIGLSQQTFGSIEPSRQQWGCQDPSSITKTKTHTYFFDKSRGAWCRNASNGVFPISSYKYEQFWADRANALLQLPEDSYSVISVFDDRHNILITQIYAETSEANAVKDIVIYSDTDKRWKVHATQQYESLGFVGNAVYGTINGQAYRFWKGQDGIFAGVRKDPRIDFIVNKEFGIDKVFDQITLSTNEAWDVAQFEIPAEFSGTQLLMLSRIFAQNLQRYESKYHGEIRGNILTPGFTSPQLALIQGQAMRGRAMKVSIQCTEEKTIILSSALVKFTHSMQTP
ncbi:MAG: hypothetical protein ACI9DM_000258 [Cyclobacteriaceae bacterium]|jgi:hypothetical protein